MEAFYSFGTIKQLLEENQIETFPYQYDIVVSDIARIPADVWPQLLKKKKYFDMPSYNGFFIWLSLSARDNMHLLPDVLKTLQLSFERYHHFLHDLFEYRLQRDSEQLQYIFSEIYSYIPFLDIYRYKRQDLAKLGIEHPTKILPKFVLESPKSGIKIAFVQADQNVGEAFDRQLHCFKKTNRYGVVKLGSSMMAVNLKKVSDRGPAWPGQQDLEKVFE